MLTMNIIIASANRYSSVGGEDLEMSYLIERLSWMDIPDKSFIGLAEHQIKYRNQKTHSVRDAMLPQLMNST
jgi:hypothetical protein